MCTVSYIPLENGVAITSNRDEKINRPPALPPTWQIVAKKSLLYPKDGLAGGTWFVMDEDGRVTVLLNGADIKHAHNGPYDKSRGIVLVEIASADNPPDAWENISLNNIEPFTMVQYYENCLFQLQWNGRSKTKTVLDPAQAYIWSSVTLYSKAVMDQRRNWFEQFLETHHPVTDVHALDFHTRTGGQDPENGLIINRNNCLKTLSITQAVVKKRHAGLLYKELSSPAMPAHRIEFQTK